jgi:thymidine kinase
MSLELIVGCMFSGKTSEIIKSVNEKKLLVISPFNEQHKRITRENAIVKNSAIISLANKIIVVWSFFLDKLMKSDRKSVEIQHYIENITIIF